MLNVFMNSLKVQLDWDTLVRIKVRHLGTFRKLDVYRGATILVLLNKLQCYLTINGLAHYSVIGQCNFNFRWFSAYLCQRLAVLIKHY